MFSIRKWWVEVNHKCSSRTWDSDLLRILASDKIHLFSRLRLQALAASNQVLVDFQACSNNLHSDSLKEEWPLDKANNSSKLNLALKVHLGHNRNLSLAPLSQPSKTWELLVQTIVDSSLQVSDNNKQHQLSELIRSNSLCLVLNKLNKLNLLDSKRLCLANLWANNNLNHYLAGNNLNNLLQEEVYLAELLQSQEVFSEEELLLDLLLELVARILVSLPKILRPRDYLDRSLQQEDQCSVKMHLLHPVECLAEVLLRLQPHRYSVKEASLPLRNQPEPGYLELHRWAGSLLPLDHYLEEELKLEVCLAVPNRLRQDYLVKQHQLLVSNQCSALLVSQSAELSQLPSQWQIPTQTIRSCLILTGTRASPSMKKLLLIMQKTSSKGFRRTFITPRAH